ncbi:MAG: hypothetical protein P9M07_03050, partial [Candidatus Aceula meridiana]|nr:hypothetical protein [Candidatus Aceula meridiana]
EKNNVIRAYLYGSLIFIIITFIASLFFVESPTETRKRKIDQAIINSFSLINNAVDTYAREFYKMPASLDVLKEESVHLRDRDLEDPETKEMYEYNITGEKTFELCATFRTSNQDKEDESSYRYLSENVLHNAGDQCLKRTLRSNINKESVELDF